MTRDEFEPTIISRPTAPAAEVTADVSRAEMDLVVGSRPRFAAAHARADIVPPSELNALVPGDLDTVVLRCLEKKSDDRYVDAAILAKALDACECAADWTVDAAASWWREHQEATKAKSENQPIEATIDFSPQQPVE